MQPLTKINVSPRHQFWVLGIIFIPFHLAADNVLIVINLIMSIVHFVFVFFQCV